MSLPTFFHIGANVSPVRDKIERNSAHIVLFAGARAYFELFL